MLRKDYGWSESALAFGAPLTLAILAVTSLLLRYVMDPMLCLVPEQFSGPQAAYAQQLCFQSQAIHPFPDSSASYYTYHQWLPCFLGLAAILCLLPHVLWRVLGGFLWMDAHALALTLADNQRQSGAGRHVMLRDSALLLRAGLKGGNWMLTAGALGRKVVGIAVCLLQMALVAGVWSPQLTTAMTEPEDSSGSLPQRVEDSNASIAIPLPTGVLTCQHAVRRFGTIQLYSLQCFMPLAGVYSKGLAFLFYLFLLLLLLSFLDTAVWTGRVLVPGLRDVTLRRHLALVSNSSQSEGGRGGVSGPAPFSSFLQQLGLDGRLLLVVTADCCGSQAAADLTSHLWFVYQGAGADVSSPASSPYAAPIPPAGPTSGGSETVGGAGDIPMVAVGEKDGHPTV